VRRRNIAIPRPDSLQSARHAEFRGSHCGCVSSPIGRGGTGIALVFSTWPVPIPLEGRRRRS
jgi:hypothetical protein